MLQRVSHQCFRYVSNVKVAEAGRRFDVENKYGQDSAGTKCSTLVTHHVQLLTTHNARCVIRNWTISLRLHYLSAGKKITWPDMWPLTVPPAQLVHQLWRNEIENSPLKQKHYRWLALFLNYTKKSSVVKMFTDWWTWSYASEKI